MNIEIDDKIGHEIKQIAAQQGKSESEIIQEMINAYVASFKKEEGNSCFHLAVKTGLISEVDTEETIIPTDLSTNKEHFADFGKIK